MDNNFMGKNEHSTSACHPQSLSSLPEAYEADLIHLIRERLGIKIQTKHKDVLKIMAKACQKFNCKPNEYLNLLTSCKDDAPVIEHLVGEITIGETYFFRDKHQMQFLRLALLPRLIAKKRLEGNLSLRIWSAGCASGEEIYTIAMMLHELLPDIKQWTISLLGSDVNTQSLQKARLARYNKWSMRSISTYHKQQYLKESEKQYILDDKIRDLVDFLYLNLNDNTYPSLLNGTNAQDLILCRNVLIYFNQESTQRVMQKLNLSLSNGGYLILGASDPVILDGTNLVYHHKDGIVFSRQDKAIKPEVKPLTTINHEKKSPHKTNGQTSWPILSTADKTAEKPLNPSAELCIKARESANLGRLDLALTYCQESLKIDATNKDTYFIYALALLELGRLQESEAAFRKTLFLDRKFIEGHFQLGLLLIKKKSYKEGLKSLQNALTIVNTYESSNIVPNSQGISYGRFAEILKAEIALYAEAGSNK